MDDNKDRIELEAEVPVRAGSARSASTQVEVELEKDEDFSSDATEEAEVAGEGEEGSLRSRITELEDRLLRSAAEFDNYRKRAMRQTEEQLKAGNDRLIVEILDVVDSFDRALQHAPTDADPGALQKGMALIHNQLTNLLGRYDVTPIVAVGQPFDPAMHEAVMQVDSDDYAEGCVATELSKGYRQGMRVIRHSKVGVSRGKKRDTDESRT